VSAAVPRLPVAPVREWATRAGLGLGAVFVALAGAEVVLRLLVPAEGYNAGRLYVRDPAWDYRTSRLLPGADAIHQGVTVRTNSHGMRDQEYARVPEPGVHRVAVIGDSFTFGQGVAAEDLFEARVERVLRSEGHAVELLNFGVPGYNTFQQLLVYERFANGFGPHRVWVVWVPFDHALQGFRWGDLERFIEHDEIPKREPASAAATRSLYRRFVQPLLVTRYFGRRAKHALSRLGHNLNRREAAELADLGSPGHRLQFASLVELARRAEANGQAFTLVLFPGLQQLDSSYYQDLLYSKLESFGAEHDIQVVNLFPAFRARDPFGLHVSLVDSHPNARAHGVAAEALLPVLRKELAGIENAPPTFR
jgi:hypothetical protein